MAHDANGRPESVHYEMVNAMLLNEFLKEHKAFVEKQRKVQEQGTTIARLEQQVKALTAGLQRIGAALESNEPAPRTVLNEQQQACGEIGKLSMATLANPVGS